MPRHSQHLPETLRVRNKSPSWPFPKLVMQPNKQGMRGHIKHQREMRGHIKHQRGMRGHIKHQKGMRGHQGWAPQVQVLSSRYLKDYNLSSWFLLELSAQNLVRDLKYTKRTWPLSLSYTNLANSLIFLSKPVLSVFSQYYKKIMLMSAVFIEELWKNNISHYVNDFTAII